MYSRNIRKIISELVYYFHGVDRKALKYLQLDSDSKIEKKLVGLVQYAVTQSPYYRKKNIFHNESFTLTQYSKFPLLEKEILRTPYSYDSIAVGKGKLRQTTGTTGMPVCVYLDRSTLSAQLLSRFRFFDWHGLDLGEAEGRFWGRSEETVSTLCRDFLLNRKVFQLKQSNRGAFCQELEDLKAFSPKYFYGYASLLLKAAKEFEGKKNIPRPCLIISTAEMLSEVQREYIEAVFHCPVTQEYGCSEVDIIAFECENKRYHLNQDRVYTEFINENSGVYEIIVTDLDNRCTPLLRYRLGDYAELTTEPCSCGRPGAVLKNIVGRTSEQLVPLPDGGFFHAVVFAHLIEDLSARGYTILQYRILHPDISQLVICLDGNWSTEQQFEMRTLIEKKIGEYTLGGVKLDIRFEPIEQDGKHSYYVKLFSED